MDNIVGVKFSGSTSLGSLVVNTRVFVTRKIRFFIKVYLYLTPIKNISQVKNLIKPVCCLNLRGGIDRCSGDPLFS